MVTAKRSNILNTKTFIDNPLLLTSRQVLSVVYVGEEFATRLVEKLCTPAASAGDRVDGASHREHDVLHVQLHVDRLRLDQRLDQHDVVQIGLVRRVRCPVFSLLAEVLKTTKPAFVLTVTNAIDVGCPFMTAAPRSCRPLVFTPAAQPIHQLCFHR